MNENKKSFYIRNLSNFEISNNNKFLFVYQSLIHPFNSSIYPFNYHDYT